LVTLLVKLEANIHNVTIVVMLNGFVMKRILADFSSKKCYFSSDFKVLDNKAIISFLYLKKEFPGKMNILIYLENFNPPGDFAPKLLINQFNIQQFGEYRISNSSKRELFSI